MNMYDLIVAKSVMNSMDRDAGIAARIRDAAPDMLEALEWAVSLYENYTLVSGGMDAGK